MGASNSRICCSDAESKKKKEEERSCQTKYVDPPNFTNNKHNPISAQLEQIAALQQPARPSGTVGVGEAGGERRRGRDVTSGRAGRRRRSQQRRRRLAQPLQLEAVCDSRNSFAQQKEHETDLEIFRNGKCGYYGSSGRRGCRLCASGADG